MISGTQGGMSAARSLRHPKAIYGLYALFVAGALALAIGLFLIDLREPLPGIERRLKTLSPINGSSISSRCSCLG